MSFDKNQGGKIREVEIFLSLESHQGTPYLPRWNLVIQLFPPMDICHCMNFQVVVRSHALNIKWWWRQMAGPSTLFFL
jgi:hypothetical protein